MWFSLKMLAVKHSSWVILRSQGWGQQCLSQVGHQQGSNPLHPSNPDHFHIWAIIHKICCSGEVGPTASALRYSYGTNDDIYMLLSSQCLYQCVCGLCKRPLPAFQSTFHLPQPLNLWIGLLLISLNFLATFCYKVTLFWLYFPGK